MFFLLHGMLPLVAIGARPGASGLLALNNFSLSYTGRLTYHQSAYYDIFFAHFTP